VPEKRLADDGKTYTYKEFLSFYGRDGRGDTLWMNAKIDDTADAKKQEQADEMWKAATPANCTGECCPNCHEETFDDFWCNYTIDRWTTKETLTASGQDAYPYAPAVTLQECPEAQEGSEARL